MSVSLVSLLGRSRLEEIFSDSAFLDYVNILTLYNSFAIGIVGDAGVRGTAQQPRLFVGMILILIFAEVLGEFRFATCGRYLKLMKPFSGLYGLIVALLMNSHASEGHC